MGDTDLCPMLVAWPAAKSAVRHSYNPVIAPGAGEYGLTVGDVERWRGLPRIEIARSPYR